MDVWQILRQLRTKRYPSSDIESNINKSFNFVSVSVIKVFTKVPNLESS